MSKREDLNYFFIYDYLVAIIAITLSADIFEFIPDIFEFLIKLFSTYGFVLARLLSLIFKAPYFPYLEARAVPASFDPNFDYLILDFLLNELFFFISYFLRSVADETDDSESKSSSSITVF